jgi:hypothetical protein
MYMHALSSPRAARAADRRPPTTIEFHVSIKSTAASASARDGASGMSRFAAPASLQVAANRFRLLPWPRAGQDGDK